VDIKQYYRVAFKILKIHKMFNRDVIKLQHHNRDSVEYTNKQNNNEFPERTNYIPRGG